MASETDFDSWARCLRLHGSPHERAMFQPVTAGRTQSALARNRDLNQAGRHEMHRLEAALGTTTCSAI